MAQSSKAAGRGQRGRNVSSHGPSSTNISLFAGGSAPSVSSEAIGASMPSINLAAVAKQQAKEKKYPLWKYVTRKEGPGSKSDGGQMCFGLATFVKVNSRAHTIELRTTCWVFHVGLEHAQGSLSTKERSWKRRMQLGWGMWQRQAKKNQNMMILFHF